MIEIVKRFLGNEYFFDNVKNTKNNIIIELIDSKLHVDYDLLIESQFSGGNISDKNLYEKLKNFLGLGRYSNAPCGGFPNFYEILSDDKKSYILYSGVNEVSHSHYKVNIHAIIRIK